MKSGLYLALLEVQKEVPQLRTDATAKVAGVSKAGKPYEYSYKYLTLGALLGAVMPVLHKHGLVAIQGTTELVGHPALRTRLIHAESGEELDEVTPLVLAQGADSQAWGAAVTYQRRYALIAMLGLSAEDDDGQSAAKPRQTARTGGGNNDERGGSFVAPAQRKTRDELLAEFREIQPQLARRDRSWMKDAILTQAGAVTGKTYTEFDALPVEALQQLVDAARTFIRGPVAA